MPSLHCPHCGQKLHVAESSLGKSKRCPSCRGVVEVPATAAEMFPSPPIALPELTESVDSSKLAEANRHLKHIKTNVDRIRVLLFVVLLYLPLAVVVLWILAMLVYPPLRP